MIQTETLVHPSQPSLKQSAQSSNYRITGQSAGQTQPGPLDGRSCAKTHWSVHLVTQVPTHWCTLSCTDSKHSFTQTPSFSPSLQDTERTSQSLNQHRSQKDLYLGKYSAASQTDLKITLRWSSKESQQQSDSRGRQTESGELFSITSYYSHRQSGLLRCFKRWPWGGCITTYQPRIKGEHAAFPSFFLLLGYLVFCRQL